MLFGAVAEAGDDTTRTSSIFAPVSAPADASYTAAMLVLAITAGIFVVVGGLLAYGVVGFRRRPDDDGSEPPQVYGSKQIELAWTVIPMLIVVVLCLATARTVYDVQGATKPPGALEVTVVGHQWWWEFRYPELGIVTANELHVPVSEPARPTPTFLTPRVGRRRPQLLGAAARRQDRRDPEPRQPHVDRAARAGPLPRPVRRVLRHAARPHAAAGRTSTRAAEFDALGARRSGEPAVADPAVAAGRRVFETTACVNCHTVARHRRRRAASAPT